MYGLHKLLWELRRDPDLAERFRADPAAVTSRYGLTGPEREAIINRDFRFLFGQGVNPYLLYFCALQIGVSRDAYYAQLRGEQPAGG